MADTLYDEDFYVWTQTQAEALRAAGRGGGKSNALDWELLAEEVEDLGRSQREAVESLIVQVLAHLYKLAWSERTEPRGHWRAEVRALRGAARRKATPNIRVLIEAELEALHIEAGAIAADQMSSYEPSVICDREARWRLDQILGSRDDPLV